MTDERFKLSKGKRYRTELNEIGERKQVNYKYYNDGR